MNTPTSTRLLESLIVWTQRTSEQIGRLEAAQSDLRADVTEIKDQLRTKAKPKRMVIAIASAVTAIATGVAAWLAT